MRVAEGPGSLRHRGDETRSALCVCNKRDFGRTVIFSCARLEFLPACFKLRNEISKDQRCKIVNGSKRRVCKGLLVVGWCPFLCCIMASSQDGDIEEAIGKLATLLNLQKTAVGAATEESEQGAGSDVVPSASDERQAKAQGRSRGGGGGRSRSRSRSRSRNHRSGGEDYSGSDNDSVSSYSGSSYSGSSRSYSSDGSRSPSTGSRSTGSFSSDDEEGNSEPRSGSRSPSQSHSRSQRGGGGGGGSVPRSSTSRRSRPASAATTRASSSGWGLTHPRPVDLWRAAHEAKDPPKKVTFWRCWDGGNGFSHLLCDAWVLLFCYFSLRQPVTLTNDQWKELVHRLNDSSRTKHIYLMQAQHKQIADEVRPLAACRGAVS